MSFSLFSAFSRLDIFLASFFLHLIFTFSFILYLSLNISALTSSLSLSFYSLSIFFLITCFSPSINLLSLSINLSFHLSHLSPVSLSFSVLFLQLLFVEIYKTFTPNKFIREFFFLTNKVLNTWTGFIVGRWCQCSYRNHFCSIKPSCHLQHLTAFQESLQGFNAAYIWFCFKNDPEFFLNYLKWMLAFILPMK